MKAKANDKRNEIKITLTREEQCNLLGLLNEIDDNPAFDGLSLDSKMWFTELYNTLYHI